MKARERQLEENARWFDIVFLVTRDRRLSRLPAFGGIFSGTEHATCFVHLQRVHTVQVDFRLRASGFS